MNVMTKVTRSRGGQTPAKPGHIPLKRLPIGPW